MQPIVEKIFIAQRGGVSMIAVASAEAISGKGLSGDRYAEDKGYWSGGDSCAVTLIEAERLDEISANHGIQVMNGEHRRNLVVRGISLARLVGKSFQIGGALFAFDKPRPPCAYIQSVTELGMATVLRGRGGICAQVVKSGTIKQSDSIIVFNRMTRING